MDCKGIEEQLSAYLDGPISPDEKEHIDNHLASCPQCSASLKGLKKTGELLKNLEEVEPPPWLTRKIMAHVREEAEQKKGLLHRLFYPLHIKIPMETFATLLIVGITLYVYKTVEPEIKFIESPPGITQTIPKDKALRPTEISPLPQQQNTKKDRSAKEATPVPSVPVEEDVLRLRGGAISDKVREERTAMDVSSKKETLDSAVMPAPVPSAPAPASREAKGSFFEAGRASEEREQRAREMGYSAARHGASKAKQQDEAISKQASGHRPAGQSKAAGAHKLMETPVTIEVKEVSIALRELEILLKQIGAQVIQRESRENMEIVFTQVKADRMDTFFEKLKAVGEIKGKIPSLAILETDSIIRIEIIKK
ncbi:MAG: hypothetical protein C0392_10195 [Syntrophus sp. (in: bacteria)]|nr:hypothetical protein [Syntrophus sp. (in: bacteria)]